MRNQQRTEFGILFHPHVSFLVVSLDESSHHQLFLLLSHDQEFSHSHAGQKII